MKKYIVFSLLFGIFFIFNFQNTLASNYNPGFGDVEPCDQYWWPNLDWVGPDYGLVEIDGCKYIYVFHTRSTPPGRVEYQITEFIRLVSPSCTTSHSFDEIKRNAYLQEFKKFGLYNVNGDSRKSM